MKRRLTALMISILIITGCFSVVYANDSVTDINSVLDAVTEIETEQADDVTTENASVNEEDVDGLSSITDELMILEQENATVGADDANTDDVNADANTGDAGGVEPSVSGNVTEPSVEKNTAVEDNAVKAEDDLGDAIKLSTQATNAYADLTLGAAYYGQLGYSQSYYDFSIKEKSHVYVVIETSHSRLDDNIEIFDSSGNTVSHTNNTIKASNSQGTNYTYKHSVNLEAGSYTLHFLSYGYENYASILVTAEPIVSLSRPSITSLTSPSAGKATVKCSSVKDALSYQFQFSKSPSFASSKTFSRPVSSYTASGLAKGTWYYVRVRPYTVYNDGLRVYGNWSRAQAVYVKKLSNKVTVSTGSKTIKYSNVKKKNQTFFVVADDKANAKLTYKLTSVPSKVKKYFSINKTSGKLTVKKGIPKGTYKIKVKVSSAATKTYNGASATKTITVKVN